jgi:hypothetical protein
MSHHDNWAGVLDSASSLSLWQWCKDAESSDEQVFQAYHSLRCMHCIGNARVKCVISVYESVPFHLRRHNWIVSRRTWKNKFMIKCDFLLVLPIFKILAFCAFNSILSSASRSNCRDCKTKVQWSVQFRSRTVPLILKQITRFIN